MVLDAERFDQTKNQRGAERPQNSEYNKQRFSRNQEESLKKKKVI